MTRSSRSAQPAGRNWSIGAAVLLLATTILYVWLIANQGTEADTGRVAVVVALFLFAVACSAGAAMLRSPESRHLAASGGTGLALSMGSLAIFSVGALLFIAAGLLIMAIAAGREERQASSKAFVILAFAAGAALPWALVLTG